jgi:hypothetical protein
VDIHLKSFLNKTIFEQLSERTGIGLFIMAAFLPKVWPLPIYGHLPIATGCNGLNPSIAFTGQSRMIACRITLTSNQTCWGRSQTASTRDWVVRWISGQANG